MVFFSFFSRSYLLSTLRGASLAGTGAVIQYNNTEGPMTRKNKAANTAAIAAAVALSLSDSWLADNLPTQGINQIRQAPSMPKLEDMQVLIEKDQNDKVNGVNIALTFSEGKKAVSGKNPKPAISELWISREIKLDQDGKYSFPFILVTRACGLDTRRDQAAMGNAVSFRFGKQGDGDDTYFAAEVPSNAALDKLMQDALKAANASPELLEDFKAKGIIKSITRGEQVTHIVEFPASKIGYTPMLFCPIGKDGKPVVDAYSDNWSSTRNRGNGHLIRFVTDAQGNETIEQVPDRSRPSAQAVRQFRGQTHKQGARAQLVAKSINDQIKAHKAFVKVLEVTAQPFNERNPARKPGSRRFVDQGPQTMEASSRSGTVAPVGAPTSNPVDIQF